ncbi:MAG: helix-turn-helix domain-containing protein, partial [Dehalococcoidia bacterium]
MPITDLDIGQNVQRARYLRGLTQTELARSVGLDRTAISRVEAGTRSLAATELVLFAEALAVAIQALLAPPPAPSQSPNLARLVLRAGPVTANDEPQLAWFAALAERAAGPGHGLALAHPDRRVCELPPGAAGELAARRTRRRIGLAPLAPILSLSDLLYRYRVFIATARFPSASRLAGCALAVPGGCSAILVNANHPARRQRFTAAHELAHLLLDVESPVSACDAGEIRPGPRSRAEQRADAFAAAFLLPKRVLT